jgi:integrase
MVKDTPSLSIKGTLRQCISGYLSSKSNVLSPSTIREYNRLKGQYSPILLDMQVKDITLPILQNEVNRYAQNHAPKSVANFSGFLTSVCRFVGLNVDSPTLPQKTRSDAYIPTKNDIKKICEYFKGSEYEVGILLSIYGLRRSELCALTLDDLDGNVLTINKALVENQDKQWVVKTTKTTDSTRQIIISDYVANLIRQQGFIYKRSPGQLYEQLSNAQLRLGIPHFPLHKMRHFFASYMHDMGYSPKQIQKSGGWKTSRIMESVYQHALDMESAQRKMSDDILSLTE